MKKLSLLLTAVVLFVSVAACGGSPTPTPPSPTAALPTAPPPTAPPTTAPPTHTPEAAVETLAEPIISEAPVRLVTVEQRADGPVIIVQGSLTDGCTQVHDSSQMSEGSAVNVILTTARPADRMCTQVVTEFTHEIALDISVLADGAYTVTVNGVAAAQPLMVGAASAELTGNVTYAQSIGLPNDATLTIQLQDTSPPAVIIAEQTYTIKGTQAPLPFAVTYNPAAIQEDHDYTLSARITDGQGNLLLINNTLVPVITKGNPAADVALTVVQVGSVEAVGAGSEAAKELLGKPWEWASFTDPATGLVDIAGPERYQMQFEADGTVFIRADCNIGSGIYSVADGSISIILGPVTRAVCEEGSLDAQFLQYLEAAVIWFTQDDDLFFDLKFDSGTMRFAAAAEDNISEGDVPESESSETGEISADALQIDLQGLADSFQWTVQPGVPASPGGIGVPAHILVTFDDEDPNEVLASDGRYLYIFPVEAYQNVGGSSVIAQVARLQALVAAANGRQENPDSPMPVLPPALSLMNRWAQFADLNFDQGAGVRYVSEFPNRQELGPWTNQGTAYYYQALTEDGRFYLSLHWPVSTAALPNTFDEAPEDVKAQAASPDTYPHYLQETKDVLNDLLPAEWQPSLARLDALIASIIFKR